MLSRLCLAFGLGPRRAPLATAAATRRFAFERLALKRSRDYETWTPVKGPVLTWLVSASERLRLRSYEFLFPLAGAFPYKGYFRKDLAEREAAALEKRGYGRHCGTRMCPVSELSAPGHQNRLSWRPIRSSQAGIHTPLDVDDVARAVAV